MACVAGINGLVVHRTPDAKVYIVNNTLFGNGVVQPGSVATGTHHFRYIPHFPYTPAI